jgi:hypothetical protein
MCQVLALGHDRNLRLMISCMESAATVADRLNASDSPAPGRPRHPVVHDDRLISALRPASRFSGYGSHVLRRQGAPLRCRRLRQAELVYRVQRAGGAVGAFVWALRLYVTHIAGRVERGLPTALRRCGYHLHDLSAFGAFERQAFRPRPASKFRPGCARHQSHRADGSYGTRSMTRSATGPMFLFVYLAENHYPGTIAGART